MLALLGGDMAKMSQSCRICLTTLPQQPSMKVVVTDEVATFLPELGLPAGSLFLVSNVFYHCAELNNAPR